MEIRDTVLKKNRSFFTAKNRTIWTISAVITGLCVFSLFLYSVRSFREKRGYPFVVRIRVVHDAKKIQFSAKGPCWISDPETGEVLQENIRFKKPIDVSVVNAGIKFDGMIFRTDSLRISTSRDKALVLDGDSYRGEADIIRTANGMDAVNRVELEDYLKGVLPCEVNCFWPSAALRAQAVVSRTFALSQALRRKNRNYDMTADTFSQVYGGKSAERWRTTRAVMETKGKVLAYGGKVFAAYFHSCCGGHTENASMLWNEDNIPPLEGVKCRWCRWSPHFRWQARVPTKAIMQKLNDSGYNIRRIDGIKAGKRDASGRLEYVSIKSGNKWFDIKAPDFASAIGGRIIKSTNMRVKKYPFFYYFSGYGWGHGVGMCQWGAFGLAVRWWSAERILKHYYPGAEIVNIRNLIEKKK